MDVPPLPTSPPTTSQPAPSATEIFAAKAHDLQSLRDAVADAASVSGPLWVTYLGAMFYLLIATGSVTHLQMLLEQPVKLPFLGVDLPLRGFFWLGPLVFLFVHAYILLHLNMLATKARAFDEALRKQLPDDLHHETREGLRRQMPTSIFVQLLTGPRDFRVGTPGMLLRLVAWASLVLGPVCLLLFFLLQFLPYQSEGIAWEQRIILLLDLRLLWIFWPHLHASEEQHTQLSALLLSRLPHRIAKLVLRLSASFSFHLPASAPQPDDQRSALSRVRASLRPDLQPPGRRTIAVMVAFAAPVAFLVATFPGELLAPASFLVWPTHQWLVAGKVDPDSNRPESLFSNRLVVSYLDIVDRTKIDDAKLSGDASALASLPVTVSLRDRNLRQAVMVGAFLPRADFTASRMQGAKLSVAKMQGASFNGARLQGADLNGAQMQGASLDGAQVQGASLDSAQIQGASLHSAQMQGAYLVGAQMQGASLHSAQMQGAYLVGAQMQGASLDSADMQGAYLLGARMQGASLYGAQMQGAFLNGARMQGASLDRAQMQGASLYGAQMQGASLDRAQMQGDSLMNANLSDASMNNTQLWRADAQGATFDNTLLDPQPALQPVTKAEFEALAKLIDTTVPEKSRFVKYSPKTHAMARIARLAPTAADDKTDSQWSERGKNLHVDTATRNDQLAKLGCDPQAAPYIADGIIQNLLVPSRTEWILPAEYLPLAKAFSNPACMGAIGLPQYFKAILKRTVSAAPPSLSTSAGSHKP